MTNVGAVKVIEEMAMAGKTRSVILARFAGDWTRRAGDILTKIYEMTEPNSVFAEARYR